MVITNTIEEEEWLHLGLVCLSFEPFFSSHTRNENINNLPQNLFILMESLWSVDLFIEEK